MAIEFKCSTCGKDLFAQDQFAGMRTTCPGCQSKMLIPHPAAATATPSLDVHIPASTTSDAPCAAPALIDTEKVIPQTSLSASEATKICPMCAETIRAAARKCRFCGEIFDARLKLEEPQPKRIDAATAAMQSTMRTDAVLRGASILATMLTTGWLSLQTLNCIVLHLNPYSLTFLAPWPVYVFNVLLIGGLFSLIRQMKSGPYHVFLAAAISIVICMPLDIALGFPVQGMEQVMAEAKKQEFYKDWTLADFHTLFAFISAFVGSVISVPVWLTTLFLAFQTRGSGQRK
ncbi:MAG: hypothetical protein WCT04_04515 [Planctomycetota bacterium]